MVAIDTPLHVDRLFIGGHWVKPSTPQQITVISASTKNIIGSTPEAHADDIDRAVAAARSAFDDPMGWSSWESGQRADLLDSLADELESRGEEIARAVATQNGMPLAIARQLESQFVVTVIRYHAELARSAVADSSHPHLLGGTTTVCHEPIGVVAAIAPWNFPQALAAFKYAAALAAGCTVVLKPSPQTVLDTKWLADAVVASGIPDGVFSIVPGGVDSGAYLVSHPQVDKVAFTGSTAVGRQIAEACARLLRPVTLELGGKSAAIILDDADLNICEIGEKLFSATLLNNGQTCYVGTRVLAPRSRYAEVLEALDDLVTSLRIGDALDENTQIGPMVSAAHRARVEQYIAKGTDSGARLITGGSRPGGLDKGWFVEPTVFADVDITSVIAREEISVRYLR